MGRFQEVQYSNCSSQLEEGCLFIVDPSKLDEVNSAGVLKSEVIISSKTYLYVERAGESGRELDRAAERETTIFNCSFN